MMLPEPESSDYANIDHLQGAEKNSVKTEPSERRLLKIVVVTLAVLCVLQAILNISLRLALYSKEASDHFPLKLSFLADLCEIPEPEQFRTQECSCCKKQLRRIVREYEALEEERQLLQGMVNRLTGHEAEDITHSGSGSFDDFDVDEGLS